MHLNKFLLFTTKRKLSNEDKWSLVTFVKRCYLHVHRDILRMLLIHLIDGLEISHKAELFNICCAVGVYTRITVSVNQIQKYYNKNAYLNLNFYRALN